MGNIYENGFDKLLSRQQDEGSLDTPIYEGTVSDPVSSLGSYQGGLSNPTEDVLSVQNVSSGATSAITWFGKETFTDTTVGKREGVDNDGTYKWIIGGSASSVDWNVTTANTLTIVGSITATTGLIGGWTINATTLTGGNATLDSAGSLSIGTGNNIFKADSNGIYLGNAVFASAPLRVSMAGALTATSATITGAITATSGTIGSFTIGTYLYTGSKTAYNDANAGVHLGSDGIGFGNNVFTVSAAGAVVATSLTLTGGTIKYGKTGFTDTVNAGYYLGSEGVYCGAASDATLFKYAVATGLIDLVGTISSRSTATIAAAINSSGNLVNDVINLRLDSSAKKILSDFTFGSTDYSGGMKCGTITWNATTGAITGGSGGVFHKGGIVFANAGVATITLDATTGNATFAGTLSGAAGTFGAITAGTLTGCTFQTASSGARTVFNTSGIHGYDATTQRYNIANDGSGWLGASNLISWTTAGVATISGFTLASSTLTATNLLIDAGNQKITLGSGNDILISNAADATYRFGVGNSTLASCPFRITKSGAVTATDIVITAKAGSNIWPTITLTGFFSAGDHTGYHTVQATLATAESETADLMILGATDNYAYCARWKQLPTTATSAISLYNIVNTSFSYAASISSGVVKIGSYFYIVYVNGGTAYMKRWNDDGSAPVSMTYSGDAYSGSMTYDGSTYLCVLGSTTKIYRYTISGTTITYYDTITLNTAVTNGSPCFSCDGTYFYAYDTTHGLLRKFNLSGVQQSTLNVGETTSELFKGLVKIQGVMYLICESPLKMDNNGYVKQIYILNLIPINNF